MSEVRVYDAPSDLVGRWVREADMQVLRAENARLRKAMQSAYDYITNHRHGKAKAMLFDGLELYRQAAWSRRSEAELTFPPN